MALWDRQENEPFHWFDRFDRFYLPQGPARTLEEAWRQTDTNRQKSTRPSSHWRAICEKWKWKERAEAYDADQRLMRLQDAQQQIAEANERHRRIAKNLQALASQKLENMAKDKERLGDMKPQDARLFIESGIEIERAALGMPSEIVQILGLSDDELINQYRALLSEITHLQRGHGDAEDTDSAS